MWLRSTQQLSESTWQLTTPVSSHLLVVGERNALVDCGLSATSPKLISEIKAVLSSSGSSSSVLDYVVVSHSHFDHIGGLGTIKGEFSQVRPVLSRLTAAELRSREQLEVVFKTDEQVSSAWKEAPKAELPDFEAAFEKPVLIAEGDSLDLGDFELQLIPSPGHTSDSCSWYLAQEKVISVGDSFGSYHGRESYSSGLSSSFEDYLASLEKLERLEVDTLVTGHSGSLSGELVGSFIKAQRQVSLELKEKADAQLEGGATLESLADELLARTLETGLLSDGPFRASHSSFIRAQAKALVTAATESSSS